MENVNSLIKKSTQLDNASIVSNVPKEETKSTNNVATKKISPSMMKDSQEIAAANVLNTRIAKTHS